MGAPSAAVATESVVPALRSSLVPLRKATDMRGSLVVAEFTDDLPFTPQRFFTVFDVPSRDVRGEHAHRQCEQFLVCLKGSVKAIVDDGLTREEFLLDSPSFGLYMPAMTWGTQYAYSPDAVLAVFASLPYDGTDYIRTYSEFQDAVVLAFVQN
ncbi:FdtA/QdtA family cupin domain-containing protein [Cryobacterium sp. Y11]|uniref:sugar 3,4-ketoisomerase n=1 Tax=Cryobacterium sp. Y11 TaxID=2045016 RepID=UPI002100B901